MGWENVLIGHKHRRVNRDALIPVDAKYIAPVYDNVQVGLGPYYRTLVGHEILVPVYKKMNVKKKK